MTKMMRTSNLELIFTNLLGLLLCCMNTTTIALANCDRAFSVSADDSYDLEQDIHLKEQAREFVDLLIQTQNAALSSSQRQSLLSQANRIFEELLTLNPGIDILIKRDWSDRQARSVNTAEARHSRLTSDIQTLEQELQALWQQSVNLREWVVLQDSLDDPKAHAELQALLQNVNEREAEGASLVVKDGETIMAFGSNGTLEFNSKGPRGHKDFTYGAQQLPNQRVLSWSGDHTLILWRLKSNGFVVDQRFGEGFNADPTKGHVGSVRGALVLLDGNILSWSADSSLILWKKRQRGGFYFDQRLGQPANKDPHQGHTQWVEGARILRDGRILSWSGDGSLIIWKLANEKFVIEQRLGGSGSKGRMKGHSKQVVGAKQLPDGSILSWSTDNSLIFWKSKKSRYVVDQRLSEVWNEDSSKGHIDSIHSVRLLADGKVVSSERTGRHILWSALLSETLQNRIDQLSRELNLLRSDLRR